MVIGLEGFYKPEIEPNMISSWERQLLLHKDSEKNAVIDLSSNSPNQKITHDQLSKMIDDCVGILLNKNFKKGMRIAIGDEAGVWFIAKIWACFRLGVTWCSVPENTPEKRKKDQIEQGGFHGLWPQGMECIMPLDNGRVSDGAYIYFTSGSTGRPKAVVLDGKALESVWRWQGEAFGVSMDSVVGWMLSVCFDASLSDIGVAISHGATLVILPRGRMGYKTWRGVVERNGITHLDMPVRMLGIWSEKQMPDCLECIVIGGEASRSGVIEKVAGKLNLINVYGPTEASICTSLIKFDEKSDPLCIGEPSRHVEYRIDGKKTLNGMIGELWIGGDAVALGYDGDTGLTNERFVEKDGIRWFKSGDRVRFEDGKWLFMGRMDRQRKLNGQMINLDEIQWWMEKYLDGWVAVLEINGRVVVFCDKKPDADTHEKIKQHLPSWAFIHQWREVESWPLTQSGKIDSKKLVEGLYGE